MIDLWETGRSDLAGPEVLATLALTDYGPTMNGNDKPYLNLPGYQVKYGTDWLRCPYLG